MRTRNAEGLALLIVLILILFGASEVRAQQCIASPPILAGVKHCATPPTHYRCNGQPSVNDPTTPMLCGPGDLPGNRFCQQFDAQGVPMGSCEKTYCQIACKPGSEPYGDKCIDRNVKLSDATALQEEGFVYVRDTATGNLLRVTDRDGFQVVTFSGFDKYGRPTSMTPDTSSPVQIGWPANGYALPEYIIADGWKVQLTWEGDCNSARLTKVVEPTASIGPITYDIAYYPDGHVHTITEHRGGKVYVSIYNEAGTLTSINTSAATSAFEMSAAKPFTDPTTAAATPDPFAYRPLPRVPVGVAPGVGAGVRMASPLGILIPIGEILAKEMGRAAMNLSALMSSRAQEIQEKKEEEYKACRKPFRDAGLLTDPTYWPDGALDKLTPCEVSARARAKQREEGIPEVALTPLQIPVLEKGTRYLTLCESQWVSDLRRCEARFQPNREARRACDLVAEERRLVCYRSHGQILNTPQLP